MNHFLSKFSFIICLMMAGIIQAKEMKYTIINLHMVTDMKNEKNNEVLFFTTNDGCKIAYKIDGDPSNPVLVLSNSIATNLNMWDGQIENFIKHFRIIRFDTRGNGLSDAPVGDYSIDRMGLDVIELLDYLKIGKANFCGLSLGGFIGQWLGIYASERIDKLILANTSSYLGPSTTWNTHIHRLRNNGDMDSFESMFISGWFPDDMPGKQEDVVFPFREMIRNTSPVGLAGSFAAVRDADFRKTNSLITNKTLIIAGKYDGVTKPEHSEQIHSVISGSELVILSAVHLSNVEKKDEFEKLVINFLEKE